MEQVSRTVKELEENDFYSIEVIECLERTSILKEFTMNVIESEDKTSETDERCPDESGDIESVTMKKSRKRTRQIKPQVHYKTLVRPKTAVGHTGYLVFANNHLKP
ncbi:hypothetical protein RF11_13800 [Thelohanellus kitauei]|uniref:tRNA (adenine(58)-N(1))-methyltransferase n=1 Tax=Thelohanellus kitauei TaxID=669202 RepID=A0A0C2MPX6_THEKT|nr:hypothetical protein RF11_13800 [Thelohanellus kitauei]